MKNTTLSSILFFVASISYFISIILTIQEGGAYTRRFYLQVLSGVLFLIAACLMLIKSRSKNKPEKSK